jgi:DNA-binding transcriptional MerR regulator
MEKSLPAIPAKRYFTIGEVSELCAVKPYVLRYWEQEFSQLRPMKRRGNRRYYQHHEVLLVRRIRELLYDHGFTISGARNRLGELPPRPADDDARVGLIDDELQADDRLPRPGLTASSAALVRQVAAAASTSVPLPAPDPVALRQELLSIRALLDV